MTGLARQFGISLRLHYRNRMALLYSYLFPTIFLLAFWMLYRYENPPLVRRIGELLTVTILGGACFGLPTTLVSERERGVWRRYRLTPVPTATLVASTVAARYLLLLTAGLLQLLLAMLLGMPAPRHPVDLLVTFTCVSFAFLGLGLVIATMADNVPAVQALGQCIFLPMLIIGGVAVPLESLPEWAQRVSAFFPGRHAVEALRGAVMGSGLAATRFNLFALLLIGAAGCLAGARLFRWDAQQRFSAVRGKGWVAVALAAWIAVGVAADARQQSRARPGSSVAAGGPSLASPPAASTQAPTAVPDATGTASSPTSSAAADAGVEGAPPGRPADQPVPPANDAVASAQSSATQQSAPPAVAPPAAIPPPSAPPAPGAPPSSAAAPLAGSVGTESLPAWRAVTLADIDREIDFTRLPPDGGVVTPIASPETEADPEVLDELETLRSRLPGWAPGKVPDVVQRVRNLLYVAAAPDVLQTPIERFTAMVVYEWLQQDIPKAQLIQALYWVALHPMDGDDSAIDELRQAGLPYAGTDPDETRNRAAFYAVKLLGRLMGRIVDK